ncbi:hypothetical protein BO70DRAFT_87277 [Aspergillus heteromorphus CBS 117.55]|uniref:Uncharacterized protein n=1 Tax=Aspergillus heteromorphus CBS 117.55 TaxID=1448321 RepID=A0A317X0Q9_9EURO|nr:uncharacterized protein BO70DRAFT_87277 [Aspergillus heteromorphus CBS 117.55]PWY91182.1 hypothetical protein BO70DRAFT_87277 [Aspergillus heteromorphus CBS 117.55]
MQGGGGRRISDDAISCHQLPHRGPLIFQPPALSASNPARVMTTRLTERSVSCGRPGAALDPSIHNKCQCVVRNPEHHLMDSHYLILFLFSTFCFSGYPILIVIITSGV